MIYIEDLTEKISQKEQSELGRKLLLRGLKTEYGLTEIPEINYNENGKPFFKAYPEIHFNISHCDKAVACILSKDPVGIDVECINPVDNDLVEFITTSQEKNSIFNCPDAALAFTVIWTKKESYCKLTGKGLNTRQEIQEILINNPAHFNIVINKTGGYVLTSCQF